MSVLLVFHGGQSFLSEKGATNQQSNACSPLTAAQGLPYNEDSLLMDDQRVNKGRSNALDALESTLVHYFSWTITPGRVRLLTSSPCCCHSSQACRQASSTRSRKKEARPLKVSAGPVHVTRGATSSSQRRVTASSSTSSSEPMLVPLARWVRPYQD